MVSQWKVCFSILLRVSLSLQVAISILIISSQHIQNMYPLIVTPVCTHKNKYYILFSDVHPRHQKTLSPEFSLSLSLGGRYVKVWDLLKGGQPLASLKNHHKTVTCLCLSSNGQRLLSGSLDR